MEFVPEEEEYTEELLTHLILFVAAVEGEDAVASSDLCPHVNLVWVEEEAAEEAADVFQTKVLSHRHREIPFPFVPSLLVLLASVPWVCVLVGHLERVASVHVLQEISRGLLGTVLAGAGYLFQALI